MTDFEKARDEAIDELVFNLPKKWKENWDYDYARYLGRDCADWAREWFEKMLGDDPKELLARYHATCKNERRYRDNLLNTQAKAKTLSADLERERKKAKKLAEALERIATGVLPYGDVRNLCYDKLGEYRGEE